MTYNKMIKNEVERDGYDSRDLSSQSVSETPRGLSCQPVALSGELKLAASQTHRKGRRFRQPDGKGSLWSMARYVPMWSGLETTTG